MNFIPDRAVYCLNYWCTFSTQLLGQPITSIKAVDAEGPEGARIARDYLTEDVIFGEHGWSAQFPPDVRRDLYFLLDDGWDVPFGLLSPDHISAFGAVELSRLRFPSFEGSSAERLQKLNTRIKAAGWRSVGLWIAAQALGDSPHGAVLQGDAMVDYWRERLRQSHAAGIEYWKVDWGVHQHDLAFRRFLTDLGHLEAPGLVIEHAYCCSPFNDTDPQKGPAEPGNSGRFINWINIRGAMHSLLAFSDVVRSYDVSAQLTTASSVDRVADLLNAPDTTSSTCILNVEDEIYLAAALGCAFGAMRSDRWHDIEGITPDPRLLRHRSGELVRAVHWQRIAPAFSGVGTQASSDILTDTWVFQRGDFWDTRVIGKAINQAAPAIVSRGMPLPKVQIPTANTSAPSGIPDVPFVVASRHPNGAIAVATLPRPTIHRTFVTPLVIVQLEITDVNAPIAVFGFYHSLMLLTHFEVEDLQIWAQDLASDQAVDISHAVHRAGKSITVPGSLIARVGKSITESVDNSDPGLLIKFIEPSSRV